MQQIGLGTFTKEDLDAGFNILVYNTQDELLYNTDLDEQNFSIADRDYLVFLPPNGETELDITAKYDSSKYDTLAAPAGSDTLLDYVGSWKYDSLPAYLVIDEAGNWYIQNLYGKQEQSGTVTLSDGTADLYLADSSYYNSLALAENSPWPTVTAMCCSTLGICPCSPPRRIRLTRPPHSRRALPT